MKKVHLLLLLLLLNYSNQILAQRNCGSAEYHQNLLQTDSEYAKNRDLIEKQIEQYVASNPNNHSRAVVNIPVVVHVIYNLNSQNITDAQIQSQIDVLNKDFRKLNTNFSSTPAYFQGFAADCEINFCLASRDPNGVTTNGITRTYTSTTGFTSNNAMKYTAQGGHDAWDRNSYLNIWVCKLNSGLLGYAQFPGGAAPSDGVVISYKAFGTTGVVTAPYNLGRTATHEIGHWLNLYHIWGDDGGSCSGDDLVGDTPNQGAENYGCPTYPHYSCASANGDMFMNYMDYTNDACMTMFSAGQKTRMVATLNTSRSSLLSSIGCLPVTNCGNFTGIYSVPASSNSQTINWNPIPGVTSYKVEYKTAAATTWNSITVMTNAATITGLITNTNYQVRLMAYCGVGASNYSDVYSFYFFNCSQSISLVGTTSSFVSNITTNSATFTWPLSSNSLTNYNVFYRKASSNIWNIIENSTNTITFNNLESDVKYELKVQVICLSSSGKSYSILSSHIDGIGAPTSPLYFSTLKKCDFPIKELEAWTSYINTAGTLTTAAAAWICSQSSDITGINVDYKYGASTTWTSTNVPSSYGWLSVPNIPSNTSFTVRARAYCSSISNVTTYGPYSTEYNFYTKNNTSVQCSDIEPNNTNLTATTITLTPNVTATTTSKLSVQNDIDFFKIVTTNAAPKLRLRLKNTAYNYLLSLYDANMNLIVDAIGAGNAYKDIIYNDATVGGTYYVKVYPPSGTANFDNIICYRLLSTISGNDFRFADENAKEESNINISNEDIQDIDLYPNPANNNINVVLNSSKQTVSTISIMNLMGQKIVFNEFVLNEGSNTLNLNISNCKSGIYIMDILVDAKHTIKKFIVE